MDRQYPEPARYYRNSQISHSPTPTDAMSSPPARSEPVATRSSSRDDREKRRSARLSGPRSIPHNGATCNNSMCDAPEIAPDERLCPGPEGYQLCSRCYKRFKIERRRAKETQRPMTDDWMQPNRPRSKSNDAPANTPYGTEESRDIEAIQRPSPVVEPWSAAAKTPSLHNFPAASLGDYGSRPPRKHRSRSRRESNEGKHESSYEEAEYYKYGRMEEEGNHHKQPRCCGILPRSRKCMIIALAVILAVVLIIVIALAVTLTRKPGFKYVPSTAQVNNTLAFQEGGATRDSVDNVTIGVGDGEDSYTYYQGNSSNFPPKEKWITFKAMWDNNQDRFKYSCGWLKNGDDNTPEMIQDIYDAIQDRANASLVDHRIILATILQETAGCPRNPPTTSSGGTRNPGLMQSHNGHQYDEKNSRLSIMQMVQDGTQGTDHGWGLVDNLNTYGNPYKAMRGYNSGYIPDSGNLSEKAGATACYVSDMANRLTGWVFAKSTCPDDAH